MDNHDYLVDNVNSKSPVDRDYEVRSTQMCSYQQDESTENCSFQQYGACGECDTTTSEKYLRILDFRHFERFYSFSQSDRRSYKKAISDGIDVSVVINVVSGNTSK